MKGFGVVLTSKMQEFFNAKTRLAKNGTQCTGWNIPAVHGEGDEKVSTAELKVAPALADFGKPGFSQFSEDFARSEDGPSARPPEWRPFCRWSSHRAKHRLRWQARRHRLQHEGRFSSQKFPARSQAKRRVDFLKERLDADRGD